MAFIGVRSSWLMLARNWLLASLAASAAALACGESLLGLLALDRVMNGPHQGAGRDLALNLIILSALANRVNRFGLVVQSCQDNDGHVRSGAVGPFHRGQSHAVRQPQIEQDTIDCSCSIQVLFGLPQLLDMRDLQLPITLR